MADKKQYFRDVKPGEVSIEGRQSNGVTADNEGNVFIYSGLKDTELDYLAETQNKDNIPLYYGNSYVAITKSQTHNTLNLGNNNYETLNEKTDPNKIIISSPLSPDDAKYDPCQKLTEADKRKFILDVVKYVLSNQGGSKKYTDVDPLDGGTVGIAHFAVDELGNLYEAMGDTMVAKYFGNDKNGEPMTVKKMTKYYSGDCIAGRNGKAENDDGWGCYSGGHNPLGIKWKEGMIAFTSNPANNVIQDNTIVKARAKQIDYAVERSSEYNTPFDWAVAVGVGNSLPALFQTWGKQYNWDAAKILEAYIKDADKFDKGDEKSKKLAKSYRGHRERRSKLIYKYFPPCSTGIKTTTQQQQQAPPPSKEETPSPPAPEINQYEVESNFIYLEDESPELSPTQLTDIIIVKDNYNEPITDAELEAENQTLADINKLKYVPLTPASGKKTGSIIALIQNNTKEYGNLGDLYYHPTPLYNQGDPSWGSKTAGGLSMSGFGCAYNTACMLLGSATKDPNKCSPISMWNSGNKFVEVNWPALAKTAGKTFAGGSSRPTPGSIAAIDEALKTQPVGFEWQGGTKFIDKGWDKGYNLRGKTVKVSPSGKKVPSKGISYTCCKQHWMVITGKNKDGTYTIFDPSGGVIRKNQTAEQIAAGLTRILRVG